MSTCIISSTINSRTDTTANLRVGGVSADVVDAPGDLEVEDGVEGVLAAVDDVRRQLQLLAAPDHVRPLAAINSRHRVYRLTCCNFRRFWKMYVERTYKG